MKTCSFDLPPTRKLGRHTSDSSRTRSAPLKEELRRMFKARGGMLLNMSAATAAWASGCLADWWIDLLFTWFFSEETPTAIIKRHRSHDYLTFWKINQLWYIPLCAHQNGPRNNEILVPLYLSRALVSAASGKWKRTTRNRSIYITLN